MSLMPLPQQSSARDVATQVALAALQRKPGDEALDLNVASLVGAQVIQSISSSINSNKETTANTISKLMERGYDKSDDFIRQLEQSTLKIDSVLLSLADNVGRR